MTINADSLGVKLDAARAITVGASGIGINIDASTMQISTNLLGVKTGTYLGTSNFVTRETPTGAINGVNATFTLANTPTAGTEQVFLNGLLLEPGAGNDYTIASATITMLVIPATGDRLKVNYQK